MFLPKIWSIIILIDLCISKVTKYCYISTKITRFDADPISYIYKQSLSLIEFISYNIIIQCNSSMKMTIFYDTYAPISIIKRLPIKLVDILNIIN